MGYCIHRIKVDFFLPCALKDAALQAVKNLHGRETNTEYATSHFSFVKTDAFLKAETLEDALRAWRWVPDLDADQNIVDLDFIGEKSGDEANLFGALAPFVRSGSQIQMVGDDGKLWRWLFQAGKLVWQPGRAVFKETVVDPHGVVVSRPSDNGYTFA